MILSGVSWAGLSRYNLFTGTGGFKLRLSHCCHKALTADPIRTFDSEKGSASFGSLCTGEFQGTLDYG